MSLALSVLGVTRGYELRLSTDPVPRARERMDSEMSKGFYECLPFDMEKNKPRSEPELTAEKRFTCSSLSPPG
jgi:hypothetical protein